MATAHPGRCPAYSLPGSQVKVTARNCAASAQSKGQQDQALFAVWCLGAGTHKNPHSCNVPFCLTCLPQILAPSYLAPCIHLLVSYRQAWPQPGSGASLCPATWVSIGFSLSSSHMARMEV